MASTSLEASISMCTITGPSVSVTFACEEDDNTHSEHSSAVLFFPAGNVSEIKIDVQDFPPGDYNLTVTVRDESGQTSTEELESLLLTGLLS